MADDAENAKAYVILGYIFWLVGLIWYLADEKMQKNKFAKFHFKQMIVMWVASIVYFIVLTIILAILAAILLYVPLLFGIIFAVIWILWLLPLVWLIQGIVNGAQGKENKLWLIGGFAKHLTF